MALQGTLKSGHHLTGIAEVLRTTLIHLLEELVDVGLGICIETIALLLKFLAEDIGKLFGGIV